MSNPEIKVNINIPDKDIERLEKTKYLFREIKQILQEIKEIDEKFSLSDIIEANEDTIFIFNCSAMLKKEHLIDMQEGLEEEFGHKCIVLNNGITLDKAIGIDYAKGRDYTTVTYYNDEGNPVKEETTQYK